MRESAGTDRWPGPVTRRRGGQGRPARFNRPRGGARLAGPAGRRPARSKSCAVRPPSGSPDGRAIDRPGPRRASATRAAGARTRRDRGVVRVLERDRPVAPQAGPSRFPGWAWCTSANPPSAGCWPPKGSLCLVTRACADAADADLLGVGAGGVELA
jgi:hypothetical protein